MFNESLMANDSDFFASSKLLIVTLKAWQMSNAVKHLAGILSITTPIVLVHNGIDIVEELRGVKQPSLLVSTIQAACCDRNVIIHIARSTTHTGPAKSCEEDYNYLTEALQSALSDVAQHNHTYSTTWRKPAIDCVIDSSTALKGCKNGDLRHYPQEVAATCQEVAAVMEREGIHTSTENLLSYVEQVIESTVENVSPMLQGIHVRRHTEIDYITGFLLSRTCAHDVAVPKNACLFGLIKRKENEYERVGTDLPHPWQ